MAGINRTTLLIALISMIFLVISPLYILKGVKENRPLGIVTEKQERLSGIIYVWQVDNSGGRWLRNEVKRFEKSNPGLFVEINRVSRERLMLLGTAGDAKGDEYPDVILSDDMVNLPALKLLQNELLYECLFEGLKQQKSKFAGWIPWAVDPPVIYINADAMEYDGIDPFLLIANNKTNIWARMETMDFGDNKVIGIGGDMLEMIAKIQPISDYLRAGRNLLDISENTKKAEQRFIKENNYLLIADSSLLYTLNINLEKGSGFTFIYMPLNNDDDSKPIVGNLRWLACIDGGDNVKIKGSIAFIEHLLSKNAQSNLEDIYAIPASEDIGNIYADNPDMKNIMKSRTLYSWIP